MADIMLNQVEVSRAVGEFEVDTGDMITVEAPIRFPIRQSLDFPELQTVITPLNDFAQDYQLEVASQANDTGFITFNFTNHTGGGPDTGEFRLEVRKTRG